MHQPIYIWRRIPMCEGIWRGILMLNCKALSLIEDLICRMWSHIWPRSMGLIMTLSLTSGHHGFTSRLRSNELFGHIRYCSWMSFFHSLLRRWVYHLCHVFRVLLFAEVLVIGHWWKLNPSISFGPEVDLVHFWKFCSICDFVWFHFFTFVLKSYLDHVFTGWCI